MPHRETPGQEDRPATTARVGGKTVSARTTLARDAPPASAEGACPDGRALPALRRFAFATPAPWAAGKTPGGQGVLAFEIQASFPMLRIRSHGNIAGGAPCPGSFQEAGAGGRRGCFSSTCVSTHFPAWLSSTTPYSPFSVCRR